MPVYGFHWLPVNNGDFDPQTLVVVAEPGSVWLVMFMLRRRCFQLRESTLMHFKRTRTHAGIYMKKQMPTLLLILMCVLKRCVSIQS